MKNMTSQRTNTEPLPAKTGEVPHAEILRLFLNRALELKQVNADPLRFEHTSKQSQSPMTH
jgi:hypothetical protein